MQCDKCRKRAVISQRYSGQRLCRRHFLQDFEGKAKKIVRFSGGLSRGDHVAVVCPGDYKGCALLYFIAMLTAKRPGITLSCIAAEEQNSRWRYPAPERDVAASLGIPFIEGLVADGNEHIRCQANGRDEDTGIRDEAPDEYLPVQALEAKGITVVMLATSLDDGAVSVLAAFLKGEPCRLIPSPGQAAFGIRLVRPFLHIPDREIALYTRLGFGLKRAGEGGYQRHPDYPEMKDLLDGYTARHPSAPFSLVNLGKRLGSVRAGMGTDYPMERDTGRRDPVKGHYRKEKPNHE